MKSDKGTLIKFMAVPLLVGALGAVLSSGGMKIFGSLEKPPLSPPGWLFPIVWTILYIFMGIASYLVYTSGAPQEQISAALTIYLYQLIVNFLWPVFFFDFGWYLFSFFWLALLWLLVFVTYRRFKLISKPAGYLMLPYLLWVSFAGYLNLGIWRLNR